MTIVSIRSSELKVVRSDILSAAVPIHLGIINTLPQVRKTMNGNEDMTDLVESIMAKGQKVAGLALALKPTQAKKYLNEVNRLWGTNHVLQRLRKVEFIDRGGIHYLILVYGHRRLKACHLAAERLAKGERSPSFNGTYRCDIHFGMSFEEAFSIQLLENLYVTPPKHEEIAAMWRFWQFMKVRNPAINPSQFAKQIGRRPEAIHDMLRFCGLPERVQAMIHPDAPAGKAPYSLLIQVARKVEAFRAYRKPMSDLEIVRLAYFLVAKRVKASDYAKRVTEEILHLQNHQEDLFTEMLGTPIETREIRKVAAAEIVQAIIRNIQYLTVVNSMMHSDAFGGISPYAEGLQLDAPARYSPLSPARLALRLVEVLKGVVPNLAEMLRRDAKSDAKLKAALSDINIAKANLLAVLGK